ncbi:MAG: hypothetical protein IPO72_00595 [Saprospiraceae bacterium]|nr:hypothetical protein [Candidatus Vicinibacter affinis]MBK9639809.1 hypothetical protein [Candidatus Vicinibacter affinis]
MNVLLEQSEYLLSNTTLDFKRFLFNEIKWNNRLVGIKEPEEQVKLHYYYNG